MQVRHTKKQSAGGSRGFFFLILKGSGIKTDLIKTEQRVKTTKQSQKFLLVCLKNEVKLSECFQLQGLPLEKICFLFLCFFEEFFWFFLKHGIKSGGKQSGQQPRLVNKVTSSSSSCVCRPSSSGWSRGSCYWTWLCPSTHTPRRSVTNTHAYTRTHACVHAHTLPCSPGAPPAAHTCFLHKYI